MTDQFDAGGIAALEAFLAELWQARGRIENETEPAFDVIVDLLERVILTMREQDEAVNL